MIVYLDSSNLVKLYAEEAGSAEIRQLAAAADAVATSALAYTEARASFARWRRERRMTAAGCDAVVRKFELDWARFVVIALDDDVSRAAGRLADRHSLTGADAVHLASFEQLLSRSGDSDVQFSCSDDRLVRAARGLA